MKILSSIAVLGACVLAAPALAQFDGLHNPGFEIIGSPPVAGGPQGWRGFNFARLRQLKDGLGPALVRTGTNSIELPSGSGPTNNFAAFTTDVFDADTLLSYNPAVTFPGEDVTVSGWYAIPADQPLTGPTPASSSSSGARTRPSSPRSRR